MEEEVEIIGVDYEADCVCISRRKKQRTSTTEVPSSSGPTHTPKRSGAVLDDCIIIGNSNIVRGGDEEEYVEVVKDIHREDSITSGLTTGMDQSRGGGDEEEYVEVVKDIQREDSITSGLTTRMDQSLSVDTLNSKEPEPTASGSTSLSAQPEDPLLDSIFSSISDMDKLAPSEADAKDQTVPSIPPFQVSLPSGILTEVSRTPKCWTVCPNCPVGMERKYHLIDVAPNSAEWGVVATQLVTTGFIVNRIRRIQNESLWQRLCYEKQLMLREKKVVNEQLLYHTSRGEVEVIAEEGLDSRLSHNGNFGAGIYFSDNPIKCDHYWSHSRCGPRHMFCCRVLLGDIKIYPNGVCEKLKREPRKEKWKPGDKNKYYDSVKGNLSGQNEFVVYNMYRVMPEYVLYYTLSHPEPWHEAVPIISPMVAFTPYQGFSGALSAMIHPTSTSTPQLQPVRKHIKKKKQKGRRRHG